MKRADAIRAIGSLALGGTMARGRLTADGSAQAGGSLVTDVRAFGAKGDGSADDSVAIQATIDAVHGQGGGVVWFPRGRYRTTTTLAVPRVLNQSIVLRGEGMRNSEYGQYLLRLVG